MSSSPISHEHSKVVKSGNEETVRYRSSLEEKWQTIVEKATRKNTTLNTTETVGGIVAHSHVGLSFVNNGPIRK